MTLPFWQAPLCRGCGAALIGSEIRYGSCGMCGRRFLTPNVAPAGKPKSKGLVLRTGRRGRRTPLSRLAFYTIRGVAR